MAFVNDYKVMDVFNAIDLHTGKMISPARIYVASSFNGGDPDYGQSQQRVINTDELSFLYKIPDPHMPWPAAEGFGVHDNADEVGYIIRGTFDVSYPDGKVDHIGPGDAYSIKKGQPFRFDGADDELGAAYAVFYSQKVGSVSSQPWEKGDGSKNGHEVMAVAELPAVEAPAGVDAKRISASDNVVLYDVVLKKGTSFPECGFMTHNCTQIIVGVSGDGTAVYPDQDYKLTEEIAAYNRAGQPYKVINTSDVDLHLLVAFNAKDEKAIEYKTVEITEFV